MGVGCPVKCVLLCHVSKWVTGSAPPPAWPTTLLLLSSAISVSLCLNCGTQCPYLPLATPFLAL
jgi:hypothetical protein